MTSKDVNMEPVTPGNTPRSDIFINPTTKQPYIPAGISSAKVLCEIIPLNDRVLLEPMDVEHLSAGGIALAGGDMKYNHAKVLAVGAGRLMASGRMAIDVNVGDTVIYGDLQNTIEDKLNGKRVLLVVEQGIVAIIKGQHD